MKKFYFTITLLFLSLLVSAQTSPTGSSTEIGITEGALSVSLSGAATYSIPIAVPPGINGVVPQINLAYNSQGGNGVAGYRWNIAGVSSITRIAATKFHDGVIDPVDFDGLDRFALDGQRLVVKNGTGGSYGFTGTVYETENFSNVKITSFGVHSSGPNFGPSYFVVEYPDGSKGYYGNVGDSRSVMEWAIAYWENPQGVRITYNYALSGNILDVTSIKYGSMGTNTPLNEIKFNYETRARYEEAYIAGRSIVRTKILRSINVLSSGVGFRNYALRQESKDNSVGYQKLISITESNGDNSKSYNPTVFDYYETTQKIIDKPSVSNTVMGDVSSLNSATLSGDFDGDGKMDFIVYPTMGTNAKKEFWMFKNFANNATISPIKISSGLFHEIFASSWLSTDGKMFPYQGITVVQSVINSQAVNFNTYTNSPNGVGVEYSRSVIFPERQIYFDCNDSVNNSQEKLFFSGDFNGDGITDVIAIDKDLEEVTCVESPYGDFTRTRSMNSTGKVYFVDLDRRKSAEYTFSGIFVESFSTSQSKIETFDVNGDGKTDILHFKNGRVSVYTLNSENQLEKLWTTSDPSININQTILPGDYNGDGKMEFIIPKSTGVTSADYYKFISTGNQFQKIEQNYGDLVNWGNTSDRDGTYNCTLIPLDINGDGKTDIIQFRSIYANATKKGVILIKIFNNTGSLFRNDTEFRTDDKTTLNSFPIPIFLSPKTNNHYLSVGLMTNSQLFTFDSQHDINNEMLIKDITTGNGVKETITYNPLQEDDYERFYIASPYVERYPNVDITVAPSFKVVTKLEKNSFSVNKKQLFFYSGAVSNAEGLGFFGFRSTVSTNWHDNSSDIISTITRNDMSLRGANIENYTVLGIHLPLIELPGIKTQKFIVRDKGYTVTGTENLVATQSIILKPDSWIKSGSTFSATINEEANNAPNTPNTDYITKSRLNYESGVLPNRVFKLQNYSTKQYNALDDTSTETYLTFDVYNNPLRSSTILKESGATVQTTVSNVSYETPASSPYVVGRPSGKNQTVTVSGDVMTSEELFVYQNSLLTQIKKKGNNTDYIIENNTFDSFGNITKKTIIASGLPARTTSYEYDPSGRFLTKSTDIEGLSTTFVYDSHGLLKSETNPYGLTTSYEYDKWFKKTETTDYLGKKSNYVYKRSGQKTIVTASAADGNVSEETFDELGRKIRSGSKNIMGSFSYVDYVYDIYDRKYKISEPYFGESGTQWNETKYDIYGRITQNISFTGQITDITYSGLTTTANDGAKSKSSTKNAIGNVISMTDTPGGTIAYRYFANGNLKESDYAGVKTTISQDGWGRKTKLVDSSAGIYTYEYNAFGETINETTPNGATAYVLDAVGKVTQKTISGTNTNSKTTYTYDATSKLLLSTKFEDLTNGTNAILNSISYDDAKRIVKTQETTPYAIFTKEITYDDFGRINTKLSTATAGGSSSSKMIKNTYKNGSHWQIIDNATNAVLLQTNTINARGQLKNAQSGGTTITNEYDDFGLASQIKYDIATSSANILTLNTVFDAKRGNLTNRSNSLFNRSESFKYDALDRLTEFTNAQGQQEKQLYDDQGRITENNLGKYSYTITGKPYQNSVIAVNPDALTYYAERPVQNILYNAFKSPVQIEEAGVDKISFNYNDSNTRTAMFYSGLQDDKLLRPNRKYYSADGSMEIKHNIITNTFEFITYIGGDGYSAPIVVKSNGSTQNYLYLQRDYQGSIVAITDQVGAIVEKRLFDAWGAVVLVQDGNGNVLAGLTVLDRGYTGHEHLQSVGLINMNGRIYDSKLRRFIQPDNNIQDLYNTQNYNRYGYVLNNPLKYTDPSGEFWNIVVGAVIGGFTNWASHGFQYNAKGLGYFGVGAAAGALTAMGVGGVSSALQSGSFFAGAFGTSTAAAVSTSFNSGVILGSTGGLIGGFTSGLGNSLIDGKNIGDSFKYGIRDGGIGAITGGIIGGVSGGLNAMSEGRDFWKGRKWIEVNTAFGKTFTSSVDFSDPIWDVEESMNLKRFIQDDSYSCTYRCKLSVDDYFRVLDQGNNNTSWFNYASAHNGVANTRLEGFYRTAGYSTNSFSGDITPNRGLPWIVGEMRNNRVVQLGWFPQSGINSGHASLVTRVRYLEDFSKYSISLMNPSPDNGRIRNFSQIYQIFSVWR